MNVVGVLKEARALIEKPENWVQGHFQAYRTTDGKVWPADNERFPVNCFCLVGAIDRVLKVDGGDEPKANHPLWLETMQALRANLPTPIQVSAFNDTHTHEAVLGLVDLTIGQWEGTV